MLVILIHNETENLLDNLSICPSLSIVKITVVCVFVRTVIGSNELAEL